MRQDWSEAVGVALDELGPPIFGLAGPLAATGVVNGLSGRPCQEITVLYRPPGGRIEVTTSRRPLGGTDHLVLALLQASVPLGDVRLPFTITVDDRLVMLPVTKLRTQFRVLESTTGHWAAVGGTPERHLRLTGTPGTSIDDLELHPAAIDLT